MKEKIIFAYSGGLDTSVMLKWLSKKDYEIIAYIADVGQKEDFKKVKEKAIKTGASKVYIKDLKKEFVENYIFEALKANAIYEGKYLLGTALSRPLIAKKQVEIAKIENTKILAHGCTGKGNDQVRFELIWMQFLPNLKIISPWKEEEWLKKFEGRKDLINYAIENNIPIDVNLKKSYSIDENLMHISYESGILEKLNNKPDQSMFKFTKSPKNANDVETDIAIEFLKGIPVKVQNISKNEIISGSLKIMNFLNDLASVNGIGRTDIVENRFIGIKSRGVYETPGGAVLIKAHKDLESITLDKEVIHLKEIIAPIIGKLIYNGFWFSPEMKFLMAAINESQKKVSGKIFMTLYKGNITITGRESKYSLYNESIASMNKQGSFNQKDAAGFIKIIGQRLKLNGEK